MLVKSYLDQKVTTTLTVLALPGKPIQSFYVVGSTSGEGYNSETARQSSCTGKSMGAFYDQQLFLSGRSGREHATATPSSDKTLLRMQMIKQGLDISYTIDNLSSFIPC